MSDAYKVTMNDATPTLICSGVGGVVMQSLGAGTTYVGGPSVTVADGYILNNLNNQPLRIESTDELWGIASPGASPVVQVLRTR